MATSDLRIGLAVSHNTEYWRPNTDLLFQLRFIHCAMVNPFILYCFPFSLTGEWKGEKSLKRCQRIVRLLLIYVTLMAKCMCASLHHPLKLLPSTLLLCTDSSQPEWFHIETYMRILGLWYANTAGAIKQVPWQIGRWFHHALIHLTNYEIIFM